MRRALEIRRRVYGPEHARTLTVLHNIAGLRLRQGRYDESQCVHERLLRLYELTLEQATEYGGDAHGAWAS